MNDLISRQAAIDALGEDALWDSDDEYETGMHTQWSMDVDAIKALPSVQPDYKDGWIYTGKKAWEFEPCEDTISRQAAIDALKQMRKDGGMVPWEGKNVFARIRKMPSAQPDIIRCRNCKFASGDSRICMKFGHSPIGELDFCAWAERRTDERSD